MTGPAQVLATVGGGMVAIGGADVVGFASANSVAESPIRLWCNGWFLAGVVTLGLGVLLTAAGGLGWFRQTQRNRAIRARLTAFLTAGQDLWAIAGSPNLPLPNTEANQWLADVREWLEKNLDPSYLARFNSDAGFDQTRWELSRDPGPRGSIFRSLNFRLHRLHEFLAELP